jgi:hypothetical protein
MRIELIDPPGSIVADGFVTGVIREQATPFPYIVIGLRVKGADPEGLPSEVTLGVNALSAIVRAPRHFI